MYVRIGRLYKVQTSPIRQADQWCVLVHIYVCASVCISACVCVCVCMCVCVSFGVARLDDPPARVCRDPQGHWLSIGWGVALGTFQFGRHGYAGIRFPTLVFIWTASKGLNPLRWQEFWLHEELLLLFELAFSFWHCPLWDWMFQRIFKPLNPWLFLPQAYLNWVCVCIIYLWTADINK